MIFGVLIYRTDSPYEDHPSERYQFPASYLSRAARMEGAWVLYYEPTKVKNSRGYYAVAKVEKIVPDPTMQDMYLVMIESGSYFEFSNPAPFRDASGLLERGLYNELGNVSGRAQAAVRPISEDDFNRIIDHGLDNTEDLLPRFDVQPDNFEVQEKQSDFKFIEERKRLAYTGNRLVRDRLFRKTILKAYDSRCAITGLKLINGGGRAEVQAAHIRPVAENGPDAVQNGLALSGTVHWMFDRGLLGVSDSKEIMISRHINDRDSVESLINKSGFLKIPSDERNHPHPVFMEWHRENRFKI